MDEEVPAIDVALVRALLAQGPDGAAGVSIRPVTSAGTDNALFRVGEGLVARLPRERWARSRRVSTAGSAIWRRACHSPFPSPCFSASLRRAIRSSGLCTAGATE